MDTPQKKKTLDTSWQSVASWYDVLLETDQDSYQAQVIAPNLLRILGMVSGKRILDLACGQGYFSRILHEAGAMVHGVDASSDLIARAKKQSSPAVEFHTCQSDNLLGIAQNSFDAVICILAIQNIEKLNETCAEVARVLKPGGTVVVVLNHPAFRIPKRSSWGIDEQTLLQYRRVDGYMSESRVEIDMHPSASGKKVTTISFHRPLQVFFKALTKNGFAITRLEEWMSHKVSEAGPKKVMEDRARKEFPLFMMIEAKKN
ncbi:MAG: class I SAM-dependent methyltransferase [Patescibacteria group bacterium]